MRKIDQDYIKSARSTVQSLRCILDMVGAPHRMARIWLDAARGYVAAAEEWVAHADELDHWNIDLLRTAVADAVYVVEKFIKSCGYQMPLASHEDLCEELQNEQHELP